MSTRRREYLKRLETLSEKEQCLHLILALRWLTALLNKRATTPPTGFSTATDTIEQINQ